MTQMTKVIIVSAEQERIEGAVAERLKEVGRGWEVISASTSMAATSTRGAYVNIWCVTTIVLAKNSTGLKPATPDRE